MLSCASLPSPLSVAVDGVAGGVEVEAAAFNDHVALDPVLSRGVDSVVTGRHPEFSAPDQHAGAFHPLIALVDRDASAVHIDALFSLESVVRRPDGDCRARNPQSGLAVDPVFPGFNMQAAGAIDGKVILRIQRRAGKPADGEWFGEIERYEKEVLVLPEGLDGPADGRMEERGAY